MFIAHRGLHTDLIRENSISAFDNAFNNGYDGIELDIRLTKDKIPVVIHDSFISRVSNGVGLVKDYTYEELANFNIGINTVERIPKLEDVLKKYHNHIIFIELKEDIDLIPYLNKENLYYISSFNYNYIKKIPKNSNYKLGVINYVFNSIVDLKKLDFLMILDVLIDDKLINYCKQQNIEVVAYGILGKKYGYKDNLKYIV